MPFPHRVVSAARRDDLKREVEASHDAGLVAEVVFRNYARIFDCPLPEDCADARSLIVGALPHAQTSIAFTWRGSRFTVLVPPSYIRYWKLTRDAENLLNERLAPEGYWARFARVPQKALAVHSGLARYGRNNIAYVPRLGSFHMLVSYYSDLPCEQESWAVPRLLERCERCTACRRACPSGAIPEDRFVVRQERCITFYSGYSGPQEHPAWLDPDWIECLVGCRRCQIVCPENRPFRRWIEDGWEFSEEETAVLLAGATGGTLRAETRAKLDATGLIEFFGLEECLQMLSAKLAILTARLPAPAGRTGRASEFCS